MLADGEVGPPGRSRWLDALLVAFLAFTLYHGGLWDRDHHPVEFTLDDDTIVQNDPRLNIRGFADFKHLVTDKYWGESYQSERLWRPVPLVSFAIDRALLGPGPIGFRWTSALLHAVTSLLVLLVFQRLLLARRLALVGALLFAAHPIHAEAVAGVVGRSEVLALLFALGGWLVHLWARGREVRGWRRLWPYPLSCACFFLAFASKEIALTAPFILVLVEVAVRSEGDAKGGRLRRCACAVGPYVLYGAVVGAYFLCRWLVLPDLLPTEGARTLGKLGLGQRLVVATLLAHDVFAALHLPEVTSAHYSLPYPETDLVPPPLLSAKVVFAGLLHLGLLGLGAWLLARRRRSLRTAGLGLWGFYLSLGPVSNLIPIGVVRADRLLYTPSFYVCALMTVVFGSAFRRRPRFLVLALLLVLLAYAWRLNTNVAAWTNDRVLWETSLARFDANQKPYSAARCHLALGSALLSDPHTVGQASEEFEQAMRLFGRDARYMRYAASARHGLAMSVEQEDPARALQLLHEAMDYNPASERVAIGIAGIHLRLSAESKDPNERKRHMRLAERAARAGTRANPNSYQLWLRLGSARVSLGRLHEAEADFTQAIARRHAPWEAHVSRGQARAGKQPRDLKGALEDYRAASAILLSAGSPHALSEQAQHFLREALFFRGVIAHDLGQPAEAQVCIQALERWYPQAEQERIGILKRAR